ncbi:hypothetical protein EC844_1371 [Acinetobacter calcoaceticus]|uniref:Uncharacterized protein n=1 Tax=Acinetobacter calcoaceticus TaxID=471 RepID=A0A4R1XAW0_ACICA|nr:hypothetical protein EC844_1371 [Acinetobacter calcoaceticus]
MKRTNTIHKKRKLIIITILLILLSYVSYKIILDFQETNETSISFSIKPNSDLKDLRINLYVIKSDSPSEWYTYYKVITVINSGTVLTNFKSKYVLAYEVEGISEFNNLYFSTGLLDNVFSRKEDYSVNYSFQNDFVRMNQATKKYSDLDNIVDLKFYDPNTTLYQITDISDENLLFLQTKSFDELKNVTKIKSEDISKLKHLTNSEKVSLVKIHNAKQFEKPLE